MTVKLESDHVLQYGIALYDKTVFVILGRLNITSLLGLKVALLCIIKLFLSTYHTGQAVDHIFART